MKNAEAVLRKILCLSVACPVLPPPRSTRRSLRGISTKPIHSASGKPVAGDYQLVPEKPDPHE